MGIRFSEAIAPGPLEEPPFSQSPFVVPGRAVQRPRLGRAAQHSPQKSIPLVPPISQLARERCACD